MKNLVPAFVLALVVTGAVASTHTSSSRSEQTRISAANSMAPIPMCPPDGSTSCGIEKP